VCTQMKTLLKGMVVPNDNPIEGIAILLSAVRLRRGDGQCVQLSVDGLSQRPGIGPLVEGKETLHCTGV